MKAMIALTLCAITSFPAFGAWGSFNAANISPSYAFTPLHLYYMSPSGSDAANGLTPGTAWATPNHAVVCGDVIIAAAGAYSAMASWGAVSNCPSISGGIDGTGGIYFATALCGGTYLGACTTTTTGGTNAMDITTSNWAVEGWANSAPGSGQAFFADSCGTRTNNLHHIAFINDISYSSGYGLDAGNCGGGTYSVDYLGFVGDIVQDSNAYTGGAAFCGGAVNINAPINQDTNSGTHILIAGNFIYANLGPSPITDCTSDLEGINLDTLDRLSYNQQIVVSNNLMWDSAGFGIMLNYAGDTSAALTLKLYNNTVFDSNADIPISSGGFGAGEINWLISSSLAYPWITNVTNNIVRPNAATGNGSTNLYGMWFSDSTTADTDLTVASNVAYGLGSVTLGTCEGNGTTNAVCSCCTAPEYVPGTNTYEDPGFANTTDLLTNWVGTPNCAAYTSAVSCMATPISDLVPSASGTAGKGYQSPGPCSANADYPTWLKGINYLHWNGTSITENAGLTSKPCGV